MPIQTHYSAAISNSIKNIIIEADFALTDLESYQTRNNLRYDHSRVANEQNHHLFRNSIRQSGALLGLGGDQLYTLGAMAKSEGLWIYDMDSRVISVHYLIKIAMLNSETPTEFLNFFARLENIALQIQNTTMLNQYFSDPQLVQLLLKLVEESTLTTHFTEVSKEIDSNGQNYTFLGTSESFIWIRNLFINNKVHITFGSHLDPNSFSKIASEINRSKLKVGNLYISNAADLRWLAPKEASFIIGLAGDIDKVNIDTKIDLLENQLVQIENVSQNKESRT